MGRPLGIGLIGVGRHGLRYARHLVADVRGARLVALSRRDEAQGRRLASKLGCAYYSRWQDLVEAPSVEAVCLAVPPGLHRPIAQAVAQTRKPLLVEKPLATSVEAARAILKAFDQAEVLLMVAHTQRYHPAVRALKARLGSIGPIRAIHAALRQEPLPQAWKRDPALAGGGSLLQIGVHLFDTIRFLTGDEASWVWCQTLRVKNPALEDVSSAVFELRSTGVLCMVETSKVSRGRTGLITVVGDKGQLVADLIQTTLQRIVGRRAWQLAVRGQIHTLVGVLEDFVRSVRRGLEPPITGLDGLQAVRLAEACRRSASEGRIIRLRA